MVALHSAPVRGATNAGQGQSNLNLAPVLNANVFGEADPQAAGAEEKVDAPETRLDLKVGGIYYSSREGESIAMIRAGSGDYELYRAGETIVGQATIAAIEPGRVIIERGGRRETVSLQQANLDTAAEAGDSEASKASGASGGSVENELASYRDEFVEDPSRIRRYLQARPVRGDDGDITGYELQPGDDDALFRLTSLKRGDVVVSIDGTALTGGSSALKAMQDLSSASQANLMVRRDGTRRRVQIRFAQ